MKGIPLSIYVRCMSMAVFSFSLPAQGSVPPAPSEQAEINPSSDKPAQGATPVMSVDVMDSKAQTYIRNLPKTATVSEQKKEEIAKRKASEGPAEIQTLEEIKVRDRLDPEDYVAPKTAPMLVFRAKLDRQRPMTPWEIAKAICIICPNSDRYTEASNIADRTQEIAKNPPSYAFIR